MEKVSNHYVPKFYLRKFSDNEKSVGMYLNETGKYIEYASIKDQACKDYLYGTDQKIEDALMDMETRASVIFNDIIKNEKIPDQSSENYMFFIYFMLIEEARVQKRADAVNRMIDANSKVALKMYKEHGRISVPDEMIEKTKFSMDIPNLIALQAAGEYLPMLFDLKSALIIIDNDSRTFITSDNPVVRYNYMYTARNYYRSFGLGSMGIQFFLPISPKHCFYLFDDVIYQTKLTEAGNIVLRDEKTIDKLNKLFSLNSYKNLFFLERGHEHYIRKIASVNKSIKKDPNKITVLGPTDNKIVFDQTTNVKEKVELKFVKLNPALKNMPLPNHMGGPVRPYAEKVEKIIKKHIQNKK